MNTDNLKGKFQDIKGNVKEAWNKVTEDKETKGKVTEELKNKDFSGAANTVKEKLTDVKTDTTTRKAS